MRSRSAGPSEPWRASAPASSRRMRRAAVSGSVVADELAVERVRERRRAGPGADRRRTTARRDRSSSSSPVPGTRSSTSASGMGAPSARSSRAARAVVGHRADVGAEQVAAAARTERWPSARCQRPSRSSTRPVRRASLDELGDVERVALGQPVDPLVGPGVARRAEQVVDEELDLVLGQGLQVHAVEVALPPQQHDRVRGRLVAPDRQEQRRHARWSRSRGRARPTRRRATGRRRRARSGARPEVAVAQRRDEVGDRGRARPGEQVAHGAERDGPGGGGRDDPDHGAVRAERRRPRPRPAVTCRRRPGRRSRSRVRRARSGRRAAPRRGRTGPSAWSCQSGRMPHACIAYIART